MKTYKELVEVTGSYCENCAKRDNCHKDIGIIRGFCNSDYVPKNGEHEEEENT